MIHKQFENIGREDIEALIIDEIIEGKTIEYKLTLPGNSRDDRKEFLADVSSFANSGGGDLVYGVKERVDDAGKNTGFPEIMLGLLGINADQEKLRLENMLRDGIDPRLPSISIKTIDGFIDGPILLIRIRQSWTPPHMSRMDSKFYSRTSAGKYPLEVSEIRSIVLLSDALPQRMHGFRNERLARIIADELPVPLQSQPRLVLHVLPRLSFEAETSIDLHAFVRQDRNRLLLAPINEDSWGISRYNYDGYVTGVEKRAYFQLFRSGSVETVSAQISGVHDQMFLCSGDRIGKGLLTALRNSIKVFTTLDIPPPFSVMVSILGVKGYWFLPAPHSNVWSLQDYSFSFEQNDLLMPDLLIEDYSVDIHTLLHPVFDILWQSVGLSRCHWYNEDGSWVG